MPQKKCPDCGTEVAICPACGRIQKPSSVLREVTKVIGQGVLVLVVLLLMVVWLEYRA
jgi:hypothetical protein